MLLQIKHWNPPQAPEALRVLRQEDRMERVKEWGGLYVAMVFSNIMMTCRYGIHFPMSWKAILYRRLIFIRSKRCLRVFLRLCGHCERWDCRVDTAPPSCRQHPTSPCVIRDASILRWNRIRADGTSHMRVHVHTHTRHTHNNRSLSHNAHLTVRLCL